MSAAGADLAIEPFFLAGPRGRLFALELRPRAVERTGLALLLCPPFAEELNRARRALQLAARGMAAHGASVLLLDVYGTGDSEGEFAEATWDTWLADLGSGVAWLRAHRSERLALWGLRTGALLALELAGRERCEQLLLWQPVAKGAVFLNQFLRLRVAADMLAAEQGSNVQALRAQLAGGETIEIGGYALNPALAAALEAADLERTPPAQLPAIAWLEAVAAVERPLSPASRALVERWQAAGAQVEAQALVAQPFWGTPEIVVPDTFIAQSVRIAQGWLPEAVQP